MILPVLEADFVIMMGPSYGSESIGLAPAAFVCNVETTRHVIERGGEWVLPWVCFAILCSIPKKANVASSTVHVHELHNHVPVGRAASAHARRDKYYVISICVVQGEPLGAEKEDQSARSSHSSFARLGFIVCKTGNKTLQTTLFTPHSYDGCVS